MRTLFVAALTWPLFLSLSCNHVPEEPSEPSPPPVAADAPTAELEPVSEPEPEPEPPPRMFRIANAPLDLLTEPRPGASLRGHVLADTPFEILDVGSGPGCDKGWASLPAHGYACLDGTQPTDQTAVAQPELVTYDPPEPHEFEHYLATGEYDHGQPVALVPSVYAKRWRRFKGMLYRDLDAWLAEQQPVGRLEGGAGNKYHFTEIVESERGPVLLRDDGQVAALDDVYLYPVSRLQGRDLVAEPLAEGLWPAFAIDYEGAPVHAAPNEDSEVHHTLPYHSPLVVRSTPVAGGRWWAVPDALGPGKDGYVNDWRSIRHPVDPVARPSGVGDDEVWIDVELDQQILQLFRGDDRVWFTLVSTGEAPMGTPKGIYEITDKMATKTMRSRPDSDDPYMVEDVPWTIHFLPSYALHGAYWHWGFGRTASHGCINMAPLDVAYLWNHIEPTIPAGWHTSWRSDDVPGTVLQVRRRDLPVPDKRQLVAGP